MPYLANASSESVALPEQTSGSMDEAKRSFKRLDDSTIKSILQNLLDDANEHDISIAHDAAVKDT